MPNLFYPDNGASKFCQNLVHIYKVTLRLTLEIQLSLPV